ncbi:MAG: FG-GAP repeat domain-containing protein [Bryobacteraceae bacterium]
MSSRRQFLRSIVAASFTVPAERLAPFVPGFLAPLLGASPSSPGPYFLDVAREAGLRTPIRSGDPKGKKHLLEMTGCGVAFFDYDHDGWPDLFFVNSTSFAPADSGLGSRNCLFRNNRDGTFTDATADSGLGVSGWGQGCCVGDYDNDGLDDLFVTYWGQNRAFSQSWPRQIPGCHGRSRSPPEGVPLEHRMLLSRLRS